MALASPGGPGSGKGRGLEEEMGGGLFAPEERRAAVGSRGNPDEELPFRAGQLVAWGLGREDSPTGCHNPNPPHPHGPVGGPAVGGSSGYRPAPRGLLRG